MFKTDSNGLVTVRLPSNLRCLSTNLTLLMHFPQRCTDNKGKASKYGVKIFARLEGFTTDSSLYTQPVAFNLSTSNQRFMEY